MAPAAFRLKVWLLQERLYREMCEALDVGYIGAAPASRDAAGFLRPEFWGEDGMHGNVAYGGVMLRHVLATISGRAHRGF